MFTVIDPGGGMRDIYGAGVFDRCLDEGISFDCCIGVSAGSANVCTFLAGQRGRTYRFYHDYSFRKEYISPSNFVKNGSLIGLDYIYSTLSNSDGEDPLDYETLKNSSAKLFIVATDAVTTTPVYFTKDDIQQDNYEVCKASSCLPIICKPRTIGYQVLYDGGLSDPLPIEKAFQEGCDKLLLLLTRPIHSIYSIYHHDEKKREIIKNRLLAYPKIADAIFNHHILYAESLEKAIQLEKEGKVLILAPDDCCGVDTIKFEQESLEKLYQKGYQDAAKIADFLEKN